MARCCQADLPADLHGAFRRESSQRLVFGQKTYELRVFENKGESELSKLAFITRFFVPAAPLTKRVLHTALFSSCLVIVLVCFACPPADASVGIVLNESLDTSLDRITGTGHSAVYFSRICPDSPVKLRLCRRGEQGSVMSNYINIGEDQPFEWNIVPFSVYLYGVEDPRDRPLFGSVKIKHSLEERYRSKYLTTLCESAPCKTSEKAEWREMVAATMIRSIYIFVVDTTVEQDRELIAQFNALPNKNHFNGVNRNCADFTRRVINTYFPHAANPDYINDFGMTSPKAIARSFTKYALRHPEANFRVLHFAQLPGTFKRSRECRDGTEQLYRSKKFLVPMILFANHELPFVFSYYLLTGRFNPEHEWDRHPTAAATEIGHQIQLAKTEKDKARARLLEVVENEERARVVGTPEEWKAFRRAFDSITEEAIRNEIVPDRKDLNRFFKHTEDVGRPLIEPNGAVWMEISDGGGTLKVGLSACNVLAPGSDSRLAYTLILARVNSVLKSPKHRRETMLEFEKDWALARSAGMRNGVSLASTVKGERGTHSTMVPASGDD
jgi:hypothetical protein